LTGPLVYGSQQGLRAYRLPRPITILKLCIAAAILAYLVWSGAVAFGPFRQLLQRPALPLGAGACLFIGLVLGAVRWWLVLKALGVVLSLGTVMRIYLIGALFSTCLPGAAGGDAIRGAYLVRELVERRTTGLFGLVIDRGLSLFGLIGVAALLIPLMSSGVAFGGVLAGYEWLCLTLLFLGGAATVLLYSVAHRARLPTSSFAWIERARPFARQLRSAILLSRKRKRLLLASCLLSILASAAVAVGIVLIAAAFRFGPPALVAALAGVIGNLSAAIPLTPGGLGIAEAAFAKVCQELGSAGGPMGTIYLAFRILMIIVSLSGVPVYLAGSSRLVPLRNPAREATGENALQSLS
jgi:uncharacterized protein (TIRG00374 family)